MKYVIDIVFIIFMIFAILVLSSEFNIVFLNRCFNNVTIGRGTSDI